VQRNGPFRGRSVAVVGDLSQDEQRYLYRKTQEIKDAVLGKKDISKYRILDRDYQAYLIFLENSTRTRESFRNAAEFHGCRVNMFDAATSSFAKNESLADAVKMLVGYATESCFIIRSGLEGVCRWLDSSVGDYCESAGFPKPSFINAGDGKHEHPTQEFLDEFSFLEQMGGDDSRIHVALVGDLWNGRTVHSKAEGLKVFKEVTVDLVAPELLAMPPVYVERMRDAGFDVRAYESVDEYLASGRAAPVWYFTRLQLERMGERVLDRANELRKSVTFRPDMIGLLPEGTRFYHPLPRDRKNPVIPTFLDELPLNGWDAQSVNGYYTRVALMGMMSGRLGEDFEGAPRAPQKFDEDFVTEASISAHAKPEVKVGIKPVENGIVIDHIASGQPVREIWDTVDKIRRILGLDVRSSHGVYHSNSGPEVFKGILSLPDILAFDRRDLKKLGAIAPGCTLNLVKDSRVIKKYRLAMPPRIYNFDRISCKNEACVSHPSHQEGAQPVFYRSGDDTFVCRYCDREHKFGEIWDV